MIALSIITAVNFRRVLWLENHKPRENLYSTLNLIFLNNYLVYSGEEKICNLCCRLLNKIVKRQRDLDISFLVRLFDLCRF
ncbi:unnamed protein product [Rotaria socialis]